MRVDRLSGANNPYQSSKTSSPADEVRQRIAEQHARYQEQQLEQQRRLEQQKPQHNNKSQRSLGAPLGDAATYQNNSAAVGDAQSTQEILRAIKRYETSNPVAPVNAQATLNGAASKDGVRGQFVGVDGMSYQGQVALSAYSQHSDQQEELQKVMPKTSIDIYV